MYVAMHTCIYVHIRIYMYTYIFICIYAWLCVYVYAYMFIYMCVHICIYILHLCTYIHICIATCLCYILCRQNCKFCLLRKGLAPGLKPLHLPRATGSVQCSHGLQPAPFSPLFLRSDVSSFWDRTSILKTSMSDLKSDVSSTETSDLRWRVSRVEDIRSQEGWKTLAGTIRPIRLKSDVWRRPISKNHEKWRTNAVCNIYR